MATSSAVSKGQAITKRHQVPPNHLAETNGEMQQPKQAFSMAQLWNGTGFIAQAAAAIFSISIASRILARPLVLFSWHPLSQISSLFLLLQAILVLQPTHTAGQRRVGQTVHASLNAVSFLLLTAGCAAVYINKERNGAAHRTTLHSSLGSLTALSLWGQHLVSLIIWALPGLYGGEARARTWWRLHRAGGYANLALLLATFCTAAGSKFVRSALEIQPWVFWAPMALIVVGVVPRIHGYKLGFGKRKAQ